MRVSYNWLKEYVEINIPPEELADRLTMAGIAVDAIEKLDRGVEGVRVGRILSLEQHPAADRLYVCTVDTGRERLQVVTGATNIATGDLVPVALPGARLPGGRIIERANFRDVESQGMLCSMSEITLGQGPREGEGILVLPSSTALGEDIVDVLDMRDVVFELDLTPNYAMHCLSVLGVAREVAAITGASLRPPSVSLEEAEGPDVGELVEIEIKDPELCPRYSARIFDGLKIAPSPLWMQRRLEISGVRPINNIVDVTNYVMLELGQPLHAFDYDRLAERRIVVRRAYPGERMVTLDGSDRPLQEDMLVIADARKAVGIAGVMGGLESEVTQHTRSILLESAHFDPLSIRKTSRALGLRTEASMRFEKWVDPNGTVTALDRAACLIQEMGAGRVLKGVADIYPKPFTPVTIGFRPDRANAVLGTRIPPRKMIAYFQRLGFEVSSGFSGKSGSKGKALEVTVPTRRKDIEEEIDLIEEIARLYGYNNIPTTLPRGSVTKGRMTAQGHLAQLCRETLLSCGLSEAVTFSFVDPRVFDKIRLPEDSPLRNALVLRNPLREEQSIMRTTLIPSLLEVLAYNAGRREHDVQVFELGAVYRPGPSAEGARRWAEELPDERLMVAGAAMGKVRQRGWNRPPMEVDFYYIKGVVEALLRRMGISVCASYGFVRSEHPAFHPGRSAALLIRDKEAGVLGEIHPDVAAEYGLSERGYLFELDFSLLAGNACLTPLYKPLPRYPSVMRDMALMVPQEVPASKIETIIRETGGELLREVRLFDVYKGDPVPAGYRSLAYSLVYRAQARTLTDAEVDALHSRIVSTLEQQLGARLRA